MGEAENTETTFTIRGRVLRNGQPLAGVTVQIFGVSPGPEEPLSDPVTTHGDGDYEIQYNPGRFDGDKDQDSRVQVRVADDRQVVLFNTPLFRSEPDILLDLIIEEHISPPPLIVRGVVTRKGGGRFDGVVRVFSVARTIQLGDDAPTGDSGAYQISYEALGSADLGELVIVRVFDAAGRERAHSVQFNAVALKVIDFEVDLLPDEEKNFVVEGLVTLEGGFAFAGGIVRASDRDLRSEELLGDSPTDGAGHYEVRYSAEQFLHHEKGSADLVVRAFDAAGVLLATSPILFNAPASAHVDLTIPADSVRPPSLFERIEAALAPLLDGVSIEDLEEDEQNQDVSFLSGETGFDKTDIARFILAHKPALHTIQPEFWFALLGGSFFEFSEGASLEDQLTAILNSLPSLDETSVRKALSRGFNQREIAITLQGRVEEWVTAFLIFAAGRLVGGGAEPTFVQSVLVDANIREPGRQQRFAFLFKQHNGLTPAFLDALVADGSFTQVEIDDVHSSFNLGDLTKADFSVVKLIKSQYRVQHPAAIRALAKNSESDWVDLVTTAFTAGQINLPIQTADVPGVNALPDAEVYGRTLERQFGRAFPTTAFAGGLGRALSSGGAGGLQHAEAFSQLLDQHPDFELLNTPIDDFFKKNFDPASLVENAELKSEVMQAQRIFKLAYTFAATNELLADKVHSAQQVYRMGETAFVQRYSDRAGLTAEAARSIWAQAANTHAAVLTVVGTLKGLQSNTLPAVLRNGTDALSTFPNWDNLFKTGDICECEHCRSVLGPAAYFADLLTFLKDRDSAKPPATPGGPVPTVKDILFSRRPDLGYLELNCENALTPLPYIDVVCEVLEAAVDPGGENDLELRGFGTVPANAADAKTAVAQALKNAFTDIVNIGKEKIELGADFSLSQVNSSDPSRWVVHGDDVTYLLKKKGTSNFFAQVLRNTKTSADELRAYPQYVNPKAYDKLRTATYPLALPFDLFAEEVRAAFQKPNLLRWDLMRTLRGPSPNNPTEGDIAAEYFGISSDPALPPSMNPGDPIDEKRIILTAAPTNPWQEVFWGETSIPGNVSNVKVFLQKTGLEYNDLLTLLDLDFINPAHNIIINHQDVSCDTAKKDIQVLDAAALDRIHRFLRLYRKLNGWKTWELDLVIRHSAIGNGNLDEAFLINLMYFVEVKKRLGARVTVEQAAALFGDLNIRTHFTRLHEKREDALYQNLFLNRRLINPIDSAFELVEVPPGVFDLPSGESLTAHHAVLLAALGIREADLVLIEGLTKTSPPFPTYINGDLKLANLSFLWRHAWLSNLLKLRAEEWKIVLKIAPQEIPVFPDLTAARDFLERSYFIKAATLAQADVDKLLEKVFHQDLSVFACPKSALEFLEKIERLKATGFKPDELNWLLAADPSAKAAVKESDAVRFLTGLRKDLQAIHSEFASSKYPFLAAPFDETQLVALLTSLLQKLNRDDAAAQLFIDVLKGEITREKTVALLPADFTIPLTISGAPNNIPIRYEPVLRLETSITEAQRDILLTDHSLAAVIDLLPYRHAIEKLFQQPGVAAVTGLPAGFSFPASITGAPNNIPISYEPVVRFTGVMIAAHYTTLLTDPSLAAVTGIAGYQQAIEEFFTFSTPLRLAVKFYEPIFTAALNALPATIDFKAQLPADLAGKISYDVEQRELRFAGIMRDDERAALDALAAEVAYHDAVNILATRPQAIAAPLDALPATINFKTQLLPDLAAKISYDAKQRLLFFAGIMRADEQAALNLLALPVETAYHNAVNRLAMQPQTLPSPDKRVWLSDIDLDESLPSNDTYAERLANAAKKALAHLSTTLAENLAVQECSDSLGLTAATARAVMTRFHPVPPDTALSFFAGTFAASTGSISADALNTWYWLNRVARILKQWKMDLEDLEHLINLTMEAGVIDFGSLPSDAAQPIAQIDKFLRTSRLLRLRDTLPETTITLFEVLEKLKAGAYPNTAFAADVELLNEAWTSADVLAFTNAVDLHYPADYFLAENWERLRRAFYFLENLSAGLDVVKMFAAPKMTEANAKTLKELLRAKFGSETWLTLSAEIQDVLRERKGAALAAYLLTQPAPPDAPTGKWENTNDLYAYYLLDVEMSACQLTSRLVQGSGSVQLFVQRCFMGLEPDVIVRADGADGDSAWRWWKWMSKYRVWEANRKVFLWPENWIEPELKKDRSSFFKDLENELLQNDINQFTVETAFSNYLEKLDGVAQLEIAGFYQEDDGGDAIVHVFGRTVGAEPHLYYYRRYDYRQWTAWQKVDLDIQGDYLIPAVINKQLFLFWPVFTETSDEKGNSNVSIPNTEKDNVDVQKTKKKLKLQMAVSAYRQGTWTTKRISKDFDQSASYDVEIVRKHYRFFAVDRSEVDGRFAIAYDGYSLGSDGSLRASMFGAFEISGCKGVPELASIPGFYDHALKPTTDSTGDRTAFLKWVELGNRDDAPDNDFTLVSGAFTQVNVAGSNMAGTATASSRDPRILKQTPGIFKMSPAWHLSYFDKLALNGQFARNAFSVSLQNPAVIGGFRGIGGHLSLVGAGLPFFYNDKTRTFFVLPSLEWITVYTGVSVSLGVSTTDSSNLGASIRSNYPQIKESFRNVEDSFQGHVQNWLESLKPDRLTPTQQQQIGQYLQLQFPEATFPEEGPPPYTIPKITNLLNRVQMRSYHQYLGGLSRSQFQERHYHFKNFYHPFVCDFAKLVYNPLKGIAALMSRETQLKDSGFSFGQTYQPTALVVEEGTESFYPKEIVDFSPDGAYSSYNWELFFHAPLLIANSLSTNQRFEEARDWYHFIFNPIGVESAIPGGSPMSKFWITKPFFETTAPQYVQQRIDNILQMLASDPTMPGFSAQAKQDLEGQVRDWRTNPFEPHRIANYRTVAYQKTVVMKYLDNLIAWGDFLFRQDSMESINEATQLYIIAAETLGPLPKKMPPQARPPLESFNELEEDFDKFSNAIVEVENLIPPLTGSVPSDGNLAPLPMLYFCIPQNDKMLGYWETVADRLFKIRHCMNIEGVVRQLALFEPPIDPAALVKAVAGGVDIASALADLNAPLPLYRFNVLLQKANEVCNDVKALGGALLSALEKKDAEAMGLLRQGHEIKLLEAVKAVREEQIDEAKEALEGAKKSKELAQIKQRYYESREFMNTGEKVAAALNTASTLLDIPVSVGYITAGVLNLIPSFILGAAGFGGTPHVTAKSGGDAFGPSARFAAEGLAHIARSLEKIASLSSTVAGYKRREEEWTFQKDLSIKEIEQSDRSIAAAELRVAIAEKELENQVLQIENAKAVDDFMHSKYTNQELYQWQVGQISGVYFQSYKLAYDLAKRAERCFRFELGLQDSSYINFGYWDSLKKGLLSGEKLQYDLRRLDAAYIEQNRRELELTKHVSLVLLDPLALIKLRETGRCFFRLPEEIFDLDYPGHYFRRIKSVSVTLPCVVGPYTTISCTLRLLKNSVRINTTDGADGYVRNTDDQGLPADDPRFIENNIPAKAIAASNAQNDSGVFELSFRDERYLPFEGAGAVSEWSLELFNDSGADFGEPLRQFDYGTISDAILHVKYTAREDAGPFKNGAVAHLREYFSQKGATPSLQLFNLRHEFPAQWHRFLNPTEVVLGENVFELVMSSSLFPFRDDGKPLKVNSIWLLADCSDPGNYSIELRPFLPAPPESKKFTLAKSNEFGGLHSDKKDSLGIDIVPTDPPVTWRLTMTGPSGDLRAEVKDVLLVLGYEWE